MTGEKALEFFVCSDYANRMAKAKRQYVCQNCGSATYRWQGQCADCGEWNTLVEEAGETVFSAKHDLSKGGRTLALETLDSDSKMPERTAGTVGQVGRLY
jgi:DNA repair protein RadA/Sms